jgi:uroporphyrinogen-III synthase
MTRYVLITRHPADCAELQGLLEPCGLTLRPYPVLRLEDVNDDEGWHEVLAHRSDEAVPTWLVMASPRAPHRFATACRNRHADRLLELPVAVVGTGTARAAEDAGLRVELVGPGHGQGLGRMLVELLDGPTTIVFACGRDRRPGLPRILSEGGHSVLPVVVYRMDPTPPRELPPLGPSLDAVVLTSPRAATFYLEGVGGRPLPCPHWALGPTTQQAATALGIGCRIPPEPTMKSLAEELCRN